jgi:hypothetical protein
MSNKEKAGKLLAELHDIAYGHNKLINKPYAYEIFEIAHSHYSAIGENEELDRECIIFIKKAVASLKSLVKLGELIVVG